MADSFYIICHFYLRKWKKVLLLQDTDNKKT